MSELIGNTLFYLWFTVFIIYAISNKVNFFVAFFWFLVMGPLGAILAFLYLKYRKEEKIKRFFRRT